MANHHLSKKQRQAIKCFIEGTNIQRLSASLRAILLDYISQNKDYLPIDLDLQLKEWSMLFELLEEFNKQHILNT